MLNEIKSTVSDPAFQRKAAHVAGGVVSVIASFVISNLVNKAIDTGIDMLMDKIQATKETPAE